MVLSTTAALATTASASQARTYTTNRDPHDVQSAISIVTATMISQ